MGGIVFSAFEAIVLMLLGAAVGLYLGYKEGFKTATRKMHELFQKFATDLNDAIKQAKGAEKK